MIKKVAVLLAVLTSISSYAQKSFEKGTNVIAIGGDLGIYYYTSKIASSTQSNSDFAANKMLNFHYERGIANWLGLGGKFQYNNYFTSTDSATKTKPSVTAYDGTLFLNAHFVRTHHLDFLAGFNIGYSSMNWEARDEYISAAKGGGLTFDLHIQPRFYFGNHIGIFINLAYVNYNYRKMDFKNTITAFNDVLDLTGGGANFGIGLQGKF